jgi:hypothetical protein
MVVMLGTGRAMLMSGRMEGPATRQHEQRKHTGVGGKCQLAPCFMHNEPARNTCNDDHSMMLALSDWI